MIDAKPHVGRLAGRLVLAAVVLAGLLLLLAAAFPFSLLRGPAERALSAALGRPVTIDRIERAEALSFVPTLRLEGVSVSGPAWAGDEPVARIERATVRLPVLPLIDGRVHIHALDLSGGRFRLVRDAAGRMSWAGGDRGDRHTGSSPLAGVSALTVRDTFVRWSDAKRGMDLLVGVEADGRGLRLQGSGRHRGTPLRFSATGGPLTGAAAKAAWPFAVRLSSPLLTLELAARTDRPLDFRHWQADAKVRATDARRLDDIIEAGLPGTQPLAFTTHVRHDGDRWTATHLVGTLGRSELSGSLAVLAPRGGRTHLDADIDAARFDFDDLATDAEHRRARAAAARIGPRVFPDTRIRLDRLGNLDGRLRFDVAHLLVRGGSMFKGLSGTLTLDHRQLEGSGLVAHLAHGDLTGRAHVDHRTGAPKLTLDLRVRDEQISDFFTGQNRLVGPVQGRVAITGAGDTFRAALAHADGRVGIVSLGGTLQRRLAVFAGGDLVKSIRVAVGGNGDQRVHVACLIADFHAQDGLLTPAPLLLDTPVSRLDGSGTISLRNEHVDIRLKGRPKQASSLRSDPPITVTGTISNPALTIGAEKEESHGLLHTIGNVLGHLESGKDAEQDRAPPVDCRALAARALR